MVCDPGRAYDRYLAMAAKMPLLTADFALLSYCDLLTEISQRGGDGVLDGLGSDLYFGAPVSRQQRLLRLCARRLQLPQKLLNARAVSRHFKLAFALSTLQMHPFERFFPGSRFSDAEVDALFGRGISAASRQRLDIFGKIIGRSNDIDEQRLLSTIIAESAAAFPKGLYTASALSLQPGYPFCDEQLVHWVRSTLPAELRVDPRSRVNKVLVREHIAEYFGELPYVSKKGSFRFDLCGLAALRYDQVHEFARRARAVVPGAADWLERNRTRLDNKYYASKFYLLAVTLPWILSRMDGTASREKVEP